MVKQIEEFAPEFNELFFRDAGVLRNREIDVLETVLPYHIPPKVPKCVGDCGDRGRVKPLR